MIKTPFVWLGAGRARKRGVAEVTAVLDDVARAGLPVPAGAVLLDELYRILLAEGVIELAGSHVLVPDSVWLSEVLYRDVRLPRLKRAVQVRAATETRTPLAAQGIDFGDPDSVASTLRRVWSAQGHAGASERHDVLVYEQVDTGQEGTAVLNHEHLSDLVTISGETNLPGPSELSHLRSFQAPDPELSPALQRLQKLLRGLRRTLGEGAWQVNWADDGQICWVTAVIH